MGGAPNCSIASSTTRAAIGETRLAEEVDGSRDGPSGKGRGREDESDGTTVRDGGRVAEVEMEGLLAAVMVDAPVRSMASTRCSCNGRPAGEDMRGAKKCADAGNGEGDWLEVMKSRNEWSD